MTAERKSFANAVTATALLAGTLDAAAASIQYYLNTGNNPARVFQFIASAVFGTATNSQQLYSWAACGLLLHYFIAFLFTLFFFLAFKSITQILTNKFLAGIVYGLFVWAVMNLAVVPLSFGKPIAVTFPKAAIAALILIAAIGIPVSLLAHRYYSKQKQF
jgi:hypothetical protein